MHAGGGYGNGGYTGGGYGNGGYAGDGYGSGGYPGGGRAAAERLRAVRAAHLFAAAPSLHVPRL